MQVWETILHRVRQKSHNLQQHAVLKGHYIECNNSGTKEQILNDPTWVESKNAELINQQRTVIRGWRMHEREDLYQLAERFAFQNIKFWLDSVMTNCGCQLGYMWNQLKTQASGRACEECSWLYHWRCEDSLCIGATPSAGSPHKGT